MKISLPCSLHRPTLAQDGSTPSLRRPLNKLVWLLAALILVVTVAALAWWTSTRWSTIPTPASATVVQDDIETLVESSGKAEAARSLQVVFQTAGRVVAIPVSVGQQVKAGQPLVQVDDTDFQLELKRAQVDLETSQAELMQAREGSATPEDIAKAEAVVRAAEAAREKARTSNITAADIAAAEANVISAQANLTKVRTGNITKADIANAEATLRSAQAKFDALKNPSLDKVSATQLVVTQAQNNLQATRDTASATKTKAELAMQQAVEALTQAQSAYATALQQWQHVQAEGTDPLNPTSANGQGRAERNTINSAQAQQYYDTYIRAEAAMRSAEQAVAQMRITYDNARQQEAVDVQNAEAKLADAQQQHDALLHPNHHDIVQAQATVDQAAATLQKLHQGGTAADIAAAQANVDQAKANLDKLKEGGTAADIAATQANVDQAKAALYALTAPAASSEIAIAEAGVAQAQFAIELAKHKLAQTTIVAPFDGSITNVETLVGATAESGKVAMTIVDTTVLHLHIALNEVDVAQIKPGQKVRVSFDAFPEEEVNGTVASVAVNGVEEQGVVTYGVRVDFKPGQLPIKVGMSASTSIVVERHEQVIQVPIDAVQSQGNTKTIQVFRDNNQFSMPVQVEIGLSNDSMTEIVSCITTKNMCLKAGDKVAVKASVGSVKGADVPTIPNTKLIPPGMH